MTGLEFLYKTAAGRIILRPLVSKPFSSFSGRLMDTRASKVLIKSFVRNNGIHVEDYETDNINCFNDFFCRKILSGLRPVDRTPEHLISPCDGLLHVYPISQDLVLPVKQSGYTISSLLRNPSLARRYEGGWCMVFRLCVSHYHRYCYPDDAFCSREVRIPGVYHTVRPTALEALPVFVENTREYCLLKTQHFGTMIQMEVGAMLVGRICNPGSPGMVQRGQEKGFFQYGGSTIILLLQKDRVRITDPEVLDHETPVRMGQMIAEGIRQ